MEIYEGNMYIEGTVKSYDYEKNIDVFKIKGETTIDHIWPLSRFGSKNEQNNQILTKVSHQAKNFDLKGIINGNRYVIKELKIDQDGKVIGQMFVSYNGGSSWFKVI